MNKTNEPVTPLGKQYEVSTFEGVKELLNDLDSGMYGGENVDGEKVAVMREVGHGLEVRTFQDNGWLRVNHYTEDGFDDGETFEGRWNK